MRNQVYIIFDRLADPIEGRREAKSRAGLSCPAFRHIYGQSLFKFIFKKTLLLRRISENFQKTMSFFLDKEEIG